MPESYYNPPQHQQDPPSWAAGLARLDSLPVGAEFILPESLIGHVLDEPEGGQGFISIPSLDWSGPVRGSLPVKPVPRRAA